MKFFTSDCNDVLGVYWDPVSKELSINLSARLGLRLRLRTSRELSKAQFAALMYRRLEVESRLRALTNSQLIDEVLATDAADFDVVVEMMDRLCPDWRVESRSGACEEVVEVNG